MDASLIRKNLFSQKIRLTKGLTCRTKAAGFFPLYLRDIIPEGRLSFPVYIKSIEGPNNAVKYLPLYHSGEIFQQNWLIRLQQMEIDRLYCRQEDLELVVDYLNNYLTLLESQGPTASQKKMRILFDHLGLTLQQAYDNLHLGQYVKAAVRQMDRVLEELEKNLQALNALWQLLLHDYSLYNHSVNVFMLTMSFMVHLRRKKAENRIMGIAALFHDVGMTRVPDDILYATRALTLDDWREIRRHPQVSYDILNRFPFIPLESLRLSLEHHENPDGSGYPQGLRQAQQHPQTAILRMLDAYAAMVASRPYRSAYSAFAAIKTLQEQQGPGGYVFDQRLLVKFIKILSM